MGCSAASRQPVEPVAGSSVQLDDSTTSLPPVGQKPPDASKVALLLEMGFSEKIARMSLQNSDNDVDKAIEYAKASVAAESASKLKSTREALSELEVDVAALEARGDVGSANNAKELARLTDILTRASCTLDDIQAGGDAELRSARRVELDRCDKLEERINALRSAHRSKNVPQVPEAVPESVIDSGAPAPADSAGEQVVHAVHAADFAGQTANEELGGETTAAFAQRSAVEIHEDDEGFLSARDADAQAHTRAVVNGLPPATTASSQVASPVPGRGHDALGRGGGVPAAAAPPSLVNAPTGMRIADAECLRLAGNDAFKRCDFNTAAERYREALLLDAENVAILCNLAAVELKLGELANAETHASVAINFSGGLSAKAFYRQAQALEGLGRFNEAVLAYQEAVKLEPRDPDMTKRLADCLKLQAQFANV